VNKNQLIRQLFSTIIIHKIVQQYSRVSDVLWHTRSFEDQCSFHDPIQFDKRFKKDSNVTRISSAVWLSSLSGNQSFKMGIKPHFGGKFANLGPIKANSSENFMKYPSTNV